MVTLTKDTASGLDISKNGYYLATGDMSDVALIDTGTLKIRHFKGHTDYVTGVAFANYNSNILATTSWDQTIRIWDVVKGVQIQQLQLPEGYSKALCFAHGDQYVLAGIQSGQIFKFELATGKYTTLIGHTADVTKLESYRDTLVSTAKDSTVGIWSLRSSQLINVIKKHNAPVLSLAMTQTRTIYALTGSQDKTMRMWNISEQEELLPTTGHTEDVNALAISEDNGYLLSGSVDKTARLWEISTGKEWLVIPSEFDTEISCVAFGLKSSIIACSAYNIISLYERSTGKLLRNLVGHDDKVQWMQFSSNGSQLYSVAWDGGVAIWDVEKGAMVSKFSTGDSVASASLLESQGLIAVGHWSGKVATWDIKSGQKALNFEGHKLATYSVQFLNNTLISASEDGQVIQWDIDKGNVIQNFEVPNLQKVVGLCNGDTLAIITDKKIELWSLKEKKLLNTLHQTNQPRFLVPLCDEKSIVVGNANGTIFQYQEK